MKKNILSLILLLPASFFAQSDNRNGNEKSFKSPESTTTQSKSTQKDGVKLSNEKNNQPISPQQSSDSTKAGATSNERYPKRPEKN
jgi:hypothetical protein